MKFPQFWVIERGQAPDPAGRPWYIKVHGWSSDSVADASRVARERLEAALSKVRVGTPLQGGYYPRLPLREELLYELVIDGEIVAAVTRNRYAARVLNTERVLVADVDIPQPEAPEPAPKARGGRLSRLFGRAEEPPPEPAPVSADDPSVLKLAHVQAWAQANPQLGVRTYLTAAGLRVLVTGTGAGPASQEARRVLQELDSDPIYIELCQQHATYRARLTAKPWRAGMSSLRVDWPYAGERERKAVATYDTRAAEFAAVELLTAQGPEPAAGSVEAQIIALHDEVSGAASGRSLA